MAKQLPDLNQIVTLTDDDLALIRDSGSGVDHKTTLAILGKYLISSNGIIVHDTETAMIADTNLKDGYRVRTLGKAAVGDGGSYLYSINTTTGIAISGGLFAEQLAEGKVGTPEQFGAVGDGADDTNSVQTALNSLDVCLINKPYSITEVNIPNTCYATCVGDGKFVNADTSPTATVPIVTVNGGGSGGTLHVDGGSVPCRGIVVLGTGVFRCDRTYVENIIHQDDDGLAQNHGILNDEGVEFHANTCEFFNILYETPVGYGGGGPQCFFTGNTAKSYVQTFITKQCLAGALHSNTNTGSETETSFWIGNFFAYDCFAQPIYNLDGRMWVGNLIADRCSEEILVNRGWLWVGSVTATGTTFDILTTNASEFTYIGKMHGGIDRDYIDKNRQVGNPSAEVPATLATKVPKGAVRIRATGTGSFVDGPVIIGEITGYFARGLLFVGGGNGKMRNLKIGRVDATIFFDSTEEDPSRIYDLRDALECHVGDSKLTIIDVNDANNITFSDKWYEAGIPKDKPSTCGKMEVYLLNSNYEPATGNTFRGQSPNDLMRFAPEDHIWNFTAGGPRISHTEADATLGTVVNGDPSSPTATVAYFKRGDFFKNAKFEYKVDDIKGWSINSDGDIAADASLVQEERGFAPQLADSIPPPVGLVPDVRGQHYLDTSTSPDTVWYGYALSAGSWIKLN